LIEGKNAVLEALKAGRTLDKVFIADGNTDRVLGQIARDAKAAGAVVSYVERKKLNDMSETGSHQGVIAMGTELEYVEVSDVLAVAAGRGEVPLIVLCDEISDPHNLGAILRSAECLGAHGVIIPKRRSAGLSSAVIEKSSAGASSHIAVAKTANLNNAIRELKEAGVWICGASGSAKSALWQNDFTVPLAIVIGSEGDGLSRLVTENCDYLVSIPMSGKVDSLNASNAAAILLYEAVRQRIYGRKQP
jgi:23S rRNA (guanosine2251-2'-O)-methyltransferase